MLSDSTVLLPHISVFLWSDTLNFTLCCSRSLSPSLFLSLSSYAFSVTLHMVCILWLTHPTQCWSIQFCFPFSCHRPLDSIRSCATLRHFFSAADFLRPRSHHEDYSWCLCLPDTEWLWSICVCAAPIVRRPLDECESEIDKSTNFSINQFAEQYRAHRWPCAVRVSASTCSDRPFI